MHPQSGAIATFETEEDALKAMFTEKLTPEEFQTVQPMNRKERRKWASKRRQATKKK